MQPPFPKKSIVFIDNAEEYWELDGVKDMSIHADRVDYIRVPTIIHPNSEIEEREYVEDLAKTGNLYAKLLLKKPTEFSGDYSNTGGISKSIADMLTEWSSIPSKTQKYALFDWDGTISAIEGFYLEPFEAYERPYLGGMASSSRQIPTLILRPGIVQTKKRNAMRGRTRKSANYKLLRDRDRYPTINPYSLTLPPKKFLDSLFVYLLRPERIVFLQKMFRTLIRNGVKVHIFTQNSHASTTNPYRKIFIEMMRRLFRKPVSVLDRMLHSTMDYTNPGENYVKRNIFRGIGLGIS